MLALDELTRSARRAYVDDRLRESYILYRQAAEEARNQGDESMAFNCLVRAADCISRVGNMEKARQLLFKARVEEPKGRDLNLALWARWLACLLSINSRPIASEFQMYMNQLETFSEEFPVPSSVLNNLYGRFAFWRGDYAQALSRFEKSWADWRPFDWGPPREGAAFFAARVCLEMGDAQRAKEWLSALDRCRSEFRITRRCLKVDLLMEIALVENAGYSQVQSIGRELEDAYTGIDSEFELRYWRVRASLLDPYGEDPSNRAHPAYQAMKQKLGLDQNVHHGFARRLLFLDYRVAALRYAAQEAPVDDLYYKGFEIPKSPASPADRETLNARLQKARAAANWAMRYARKVDAWLECDLRQRMVADRRKRIEAIAARAGVSG